MEQDFSFLIQLFEALASPNEEIRKPASDSIVEMIQSNPMNFLFLTSQIIFQDGFPNSIYRMSFTLMSRSLTPSVNISIDLIARTFLDPENDEKRKAIKSAALRGIMFDDQVIRQQASYCIYLLLQIEKEQWSDLFPALYEIVSKYPMEARCGAIYCFRNIIVSKIPFDFIQEFIQSFYYFVIHSFLSTEEIPELFFDECFECYLAILNRFGESSNINDDIAKKCFEVIHKSIDIYNLSKSNFYFSALFTIFKGIYSTSIISYMQEYLDLSTKILKEGDFNQQIDVFLMWEKIARFEFDQQNRQNIIDSVAQSFFPLILKVICTGIQSTDDINDFFDPTIDESNNSKRAFNAGRKCLSTFYKVAPEIIFQFVSELWKPENFSSLDQIINALVSIIPIVKRYPEYKPLINFINDDVKNIVFPMMIHENENISILALILIRKAVSKFGNFISNDDQFNTLLNYLIQSSTNNDHTIPYCSLVLFHIFKNINANIISNFSNFDKLDNSLVARNFDHVLQTLYFYLSKANSYQNIKTIFCTFSSFILIIPDFRIDIIFEVQENIVKKTISQTLSSQNDMSQEVIFTLQTSMIDVIQSIADRSYYLKDRKLQNADEIIKLLFSLSKQSKTAVYEETLTAFSSIIICMKQDYAPYIDETMNLIMVMIQSGSPGILRLVALTIHDLFCQLNQLMKPYCEPVFKVLFPMICGGNIDRELTINLVLALSSTLKLIEFVQYKNEFLKILLQLATTVYLNPSDKNEIKFISSFFQSIFYAFSSVVESSLGDPEFQAIPYNQVFLPLINLYINTQFYDGKSLISFCLLIQSIAHLYGRRINLKLNNRRITKLIKDAQNYEDLRVKKAASETLEMLTHL